MEKEDFAELLEKEVIKLGINDPVGNQLGYYSSQELDTFYYCFLIGLGYNSKMEKGS